MEDVTPRTAALATLIERSLTRLSSAPPDTEPQELLFLGNWHDTVPRALIHDHALTATEMALWLVLKTYADPNHGTAFPKHEILMQHLNTSRLPLIDALTILRLTRWLSLCGRVRGSDTQLYQRVVYALHDEPLPFADALHLDSAYMEFLNTTRTKGVGRSKEIADGVFSTIESEIKKGSPEAAPYALNRVSARIEATAPEREQFNSLDSESFSFFAAKRKRSQTDMTQTAAPKVIGFSAQSASNELFNDLNNSGSPRVHIWDTGPNWPRVQNSDSSTPCGRVQNPDSSTNEFSPQNSLKMIENNGLNQNETDHNHLEINGSPRVQNLDAGPNCAGVQNSDSSTDLARAGSSSFYIDSKNIYRTTTTSKKYKNTNTRENARVRETAPFASGSAAEPHHNMSKEAELAWIATLHIPPQFPGNEGGLTPSYLKTLVDLDHSQDVLDECAGRIKWDRTTPVRNRLTYLRGICQRVNAGQFRLSSYGLRYRNEREQPPVPVVEAAKASAAPVDRDFVANQIDEAKRRLRGSPR